MALGLCSYHGMATKCRRIQAVWRRRQRPLATVGNRNLVLSHAAVAPLVYRRLASRPCSHCWCRSTTIATAAVANLLGGSTVVSMSRTPDIMGDAAHYILTRKSSATTGNFFIDDVVLAQEVCVRIVVIVRYLLSVCLSARPSLPRSTRSFAAGSIVSFCREGWCWTAVYTNSPSNCVHMSRDAT